MAAAIALVGVVNTSNHTAPRPAILAGDGSKCIDKHACTAVWAEGTSKGLCNDLPSEAMMGGKTLREAPYFMISEV